MLTDNLEDFVWAMNPSHSLKDALWGETWLKLADNCVVLSNSIFVPLFLEAQDVISF